MKRGLFFLIVSIVFTAFLACGGDDESENTTVPNDNICIVDVTPIPMVPKPKNILVRLNDDLSNIKSQTVDLSSLELKSLLTHSNETSFDNDVLNSHFPVAVDFYADWCGPCNNMAPYFKDLAKLYPEIKFVKYDVDDDSYTPGSPGYDYDISVIPTFDFFYKGKEYTQYRFTGASVNLLVSNVKAFLAEVKSQ